MLHFTPHIHLLQYDFGWTQKIELKITYPRISLHFHQNRFQYPLQDQRNYIIGKLVLPF